MIDIAGAVRPARGRSRSEVVVEALIERNPAVRTSRGFHRSVFDAIFDDAFFNWFGYLPNDSELFARASRRWGRRRALELVVAKVEELNAWRSCRFIPDAFLIDSPKRTVVCYEVEDTNPLKQKPLRQYSVGWWALSEIWWDLHLIAYDVYGNHRIISAPEAGVLGAAYGPNARLR